MPCAFVTLPSGPPSLEARHAFETQALIDHGRRTLDLRQRLDDFVRLVFSRNVEVLQRALGLRAPELVCRHIDGAESVAFNTELHEYGTHLGSRVQNRFIGLDGSIAVWQRPGYPWTE